MGPADRQTTLLIVDDDTQLNDLLVSYLSDFGFQVWTTTEPTAAMTYLASGGIDLVVLDVMMPGMDGFTLLKKLRETSRIPVIMLTARGDVTDRVVGLELGADDYLPKPFEPRELVARIRTVLKRTSGDPEETDRLETERGLVLLLSRREARLNGNPLDLTTMEYELLALLVQKRGRVLSRDFIMEALKGYEWESYDRSIDVAISRLRAKLGDNPAQPEFIRTVRGAGYMFIG